MIPRRFAYSLALLVACASTAPAPKTAPKPESAAADATPTQLTPEQKARDAARAPLASALIDAFTNGAPRVVYTDPAPALLTETSPDGSRALLLRFNSNSDVVLFEIALGTGQPRRIFPPEGKKITMNDARYSADGTRAFAAGDDGADGEYVYALDLATGAVTGQYRQDSPPTAFVSTIQASPRGDQIAITVNA